MRLNEHVYRVAVTFKMTERVEQWICITFCVKREHCLCGKYFDDAEGRSYGQQVIASFITTVHLLVHHVLYRVFRWNIKSPRWLPRFGALRLLAFPKTKITFERDFRPSIRFRKMWWDRYSSPNCWWRLGELCEVPRAYLEENWGVIDLCTVFIVSLSINVHFSYFVAGSYLDRPHGLMGNTRRYRRRKNTGKRTIDGNMLGGKKHLVWHTGLFLVFGCCCC